MKEVSNAGERSNRILRHPIEIGGDGGHSQSPVIDEGRTVVVTRLREGLRLSTLETHRATFARDAPLRGGSRLPGPRTRNTAHGNTPRIPYPLEAHAGGAAGRQWASRWRPRY